MAEFKQNQVFNFQAFGSTVYPVSINVNSYRYNHNLMVGMISREDGFTEPFGNISVNIDKLPPYHGACG